MYCRLDGTPLIQGKSNTIYDSKNAHAGTSKMIPNIYTFDTFALSCPRSNNLAKLLRDWQYYSFYGLVCNILYMMHNSTENGELFMSIERYGSTSKMICYLAYYGGPKFHDISVSCYFAYRLVLLEWQVK